MSENTVQTQLPVIVGKPKSIKGGVDHNAPDSRYPCGDRNCKDGYRIERNSYRSVDQERALMAELMKNPENWHEHMHTQPIRNGSGWLERKTSGEIVYHTPWLKEHKPFDASAPSNNPKARVETQEKAFARMVKEFDLNSNDHTRRVIGQQTGKGWVVAATDGHRAIMRPGTSPNKLALDMSGEDWKSPGCAVIRDKEFYNAVKRAQLMVEPRTNRIRLKTIKTSDTQGIEISTSHSETSRDGNDAGEFSEFIACEVSKAGFEVGLNVEYLLDVLGVWPLKMSWKDKDTQVAFEPDMGAWSGEQASWRAVVMPMRF